MRKCSIEAYNRCGLKHQCGPRYDAVFCEGSQCHTFNKEIEMKMRSLKGGLETFMGGSQIGRLAIAEDMIRFQQQELRQVRHDLDSWRSAALFYKEQVGNWIPVTERLPDDPYEYVLVVLKSLHTKRRVIIMGKYDGEAWYGSYNDSLYEVSYWMPLPALPGGV